MLNTLLKVFSIRFAGSVAGFASALILLGFLDPVMLGLFYVIDSTALLIALIGSFSVPSAILPLRGEVGEDETARRELDQTLFLITLLQVLAVLGAGAVLVGVITQGSFESVWLYVLLLAPIAALRLFLFDYHRANEKFMLAAMLEDRKGRNVFFALFLAGLVLVDVPEDIRLEATLACLSLAAFLPVLAGSVALRLANRMRGLRMDRVRARLAHVGRMVLKLASYSVMVRAFPPMMLSLTGFLGGAPAAATLGLVYSMAGTAEMATGTARVSLIKGMGKLGEGDHSAFNRSLVASMLFSVTGVLLAILAFALIGIPLLDRFYDLEALPTFETTVGVMLLVALIKAATTFQEVVLKNMGDVRSLSWSYVCGILLATLFSCAMLASWGAAAAALGHLILFFFVGVWNWIYVERHYKAPRFSISLFLSLMANVKRRLHR